MSLSAASGVLVPFDGNRHLTNFRMRDSVGGLTEGALVGLFPGDTNYGFVLVLDDFKI
jgi:hypothetical protein